MTKCYEHEECEFNGQPECRLALIERLNQYSQSLIAFHMGGEFSDMCVDAATALSTLQAENEKLKRALAEMWFAYENKDGAVPHDFEEKAVAMAQEILGPWGEMVKWLKRKQEED